MNVEAMFRLFHDADLPVATAHDVTAMTAPLKVTGLPGPERTGRARTPRAIQACPVPGH
ncbi:hypothetical protein [Streptomyces sp. NPDC004232]|uniref:hypothetical protein n=1 Tax=unclassified Streptomyces TaxID=2593676 RepID=UPI001E042489|nr:hypothetical protein [Streptomyces sp. tea 10]